MAGAMQGGAARGGTAAGSKRATVWGGGGAARACPAAASAAWRRRQSRRRLPPSDRRAWPCFPPCCACSVLDSATPAELDTWCRDTPAGSLLLVGTGTAVLEADSEIPPCAMYPVADQGAQGASGLAANGTHAPAASTAAPGMSLAALAPLAAAAAAGAAGRVLWRCRRRRLHSQQGPDCEMLLQAGREQQPDRQVDGSAGDRAALTRRARLAALVSSEIGGSIEVLPIAGLPAALAHQLAPLEGSGQGSPLAAEAQGPPPAGRAGGGDANRSRQWGLSTVSLQLKPGALEVGGSGGGGWGRAAARQQKGGENTCMYSRAPSHPPLPGCLLPSPCAAGTGRRGAAGGAGAGRLWGRVHGTPAGGGGGCQGGRQGMR